MVICIAHLKNLVNVFITWLAKYAYRSMPLMFNTQLKSMDAVDSPGLHHQPEHSIHGSHAICGFSA
jgi:hypothetical protein